MDTQYYRVRVTDIEVIADFIIPALSESMAEHIVALAYPDAEWNIRRVYG